MKKLKSEELPQFKAVLSRKISERRNIDYKLLGELDSCLRGDLERTFFVDEFPELSAALSTSLSTSITTHGSQKPKHDVEYLRNVITCYGDTSEAIKNLLLHVTEIDWHIPLVFTGLQPFLHVLEEIAVNQGGTMEKELCPCLHVQLESLPQYTLPEGYTLSELSGNDASVVRGAWQYSSESENTEQYIHWLISSYKTIAVHDCTTKLVAYMIQCHNGSIGMLRVDPDHRRKGLAKVVITELARRVLLCGQPAYVFVDNEVSLQLHQKCGFQKICDAFWAFYTPSSCKTSAAKCCVVSEKMLKLSINQLPSIEKRLLDIGRTNDADYIHKMRGGLRYTLNGLMERSFYVDQYPEFSAIVSMLPEDGDQKDSPVLFLKRIVDCYATSGDKLLKLLLEIKDIQWNKFFLICSSTVFLKELESLTDLKPVNLKIHTHPVFEAKVDDIPKFELPQGYYLSSLNDLDAVEINNSWTYASEGTEAFIRWLIKNFTTLAVRTGDSSLVAYMLPQGNGSLGMLNVYPDHRRRGLGQLVVSELVHKVKKPGETVYVHTNNNISIRLHEKCGFKKIIDSLWLEITPK